MTRDWISNLLKAILLLYGVILCGLMLFGEQIQTAYFIIPNYVLLIVAVAFIIVVARTARPNSVLTVLEKSENLTLLVVSIILYFIQLFITYEIIFRTAWDVEAIGYGSIYASSQDPAGLQNMSEYYSIYPNNLFLTWIFSLILRLNRILGNHITNNYLLTAMVQCLVMNVSGAIMFKCEKRFISIRLSWIGYALYVVMIMLSGWMVLPYSDGMGVIFPISMLYLYLRCKECSRNGMRYVYIGLIFALGIVGYHIKPYVAIILIAIASLELIEWIQHREQTRRHIVGVGVAVLCACGMQLLVSAANSSMGFTIDHERELGIPHYLMMGANIEHWGGYSDEDLAFGDDIPLKTDRNKAEIQEFHNRLHDMGMSGYLELAAHKISKCYLDGTYSWRTAESFYREIYEERGNALCAPLRDWYYGYGDTFKFHAVIHQFLWIMILVLAPVSMLTRRQLVLTEKVVVMSVGGLILYLLIFEAQARYVFVFVPFYIILALNGMQILRGLFGRR